MSCCFLRQRRAPDVARAGGYVFPAALHDRLVGRNTGNLLWTIENLRRKLGEDAGGPRYCIFNKPDIGLPDAQECDTAAEAALCLSG